MLQFNIDYLLTLRGITKPHRFLRGEGFSDHKIYRFLKRKNRLFDLDDIEKLCDLFNCTPNDLLEWKNDKNKKIDKKYPLQNLMRKPIKDYSEITKDLTPDEMIKLQDKLYTIKEEL